MRHWGARSFGPLLIGKHILVAQNLLNRHPAARFEGNTKSPNVLPDLHKIYTHFGYPTTHITDSSPPLNSQYFTSFAQQHDITHHTTYPYHRQAKPAERITKPLGKTCRAA